MSNIFSQQNNHPLTERTQTYFLERKHVSIHTEDRDYFKYPNSNYFEVILPNDLINITYMKLSDITIPTKLYTFTNNYQNTKFIINVIPQIDDPDISYAFNALDDYYKQNKIYEICIDEGFYSPEQLANEIQNKMNYTITKTLIDASYSLPSDYMYDNFYVKYNPSSHKIEFINNRDIFNLYFSVKIDYETDCIFKDIFCNTTKWGFPYYIGYDRKTYEPLINNGSYTIGSINFVVNPSTDKLDNKIYYSQSDFILNLDSDNVIYMEIDKYNSIDELDPYPFLLNNNDYTGRTNNAFAKIPIIRQNDGLKAFVPQNYFLFDITRFKIPIQNIRQLRFKFRFHDGRLVDFKNQDFNFTIEFGQLIDEQLKYKIINTGY